MSVLAISVWVMPAAVAAVPYFTSKRSGIVERCARTLYVTL